jgi:hypothetical protein
MIFHPSTTIFEPFYVNPWTFFIIIISFLQPIHAISPVLVSCNCPRFNTTAPIFVSCIDGTGSLTVGGWVDYSAGPPTDWIPTTNHYSIDQCGEAQTNSNALEVLHAFKIHVGMEGFYRIESISNHASPDPFDYTVVMQLETSYPLLVIDSDGTHDDSKLACAIGDKKDGNSYQAQITEYLGSDQYYVLIMEAKVGSVDAMNVGFMLTRVESTQSPTPVPTVPTTLLASTGKPTPIPMTLTLTLEPTLPPGGVEGMTSSSLNHHIRCWYYYYFIDVVIVCWLVD